MTRHMIRWLLFSIVATSSLLLARGGLADSMWDRRDSRSSHLFVDNRARRAGDLLTVVVREITDAKSSEDRKLDKDTATSGKFSFSGKSSANGGGRDAAAELSSNHSSNRTFEGSSAFESDRQFKDQMTVTVTDVLPNGNLMIEGYRKRVVANETRLLRISGIVRPNDIENGNFVESRFIANFNVAYEGSGVESKFTNQGWLGRVGNKVWPW